MSLAQFKAVPRKVMRLSEEQVVKTGTLESGSPFPLVIEPSSGPVNLIAWAEAHRDDLKDKLSRHGAVLFRNFQIGSAEEFERFVVAGCGGSLEYKERSSPRTQVSGRIYTSTDYPPEMPIFLHNEQSYSLTFFLRILFCCLIAAESGGATPIADVRKVYQRIDPEVRRRFAREGYLYVRNFGDGFGLSWQEAFKTEDPSAVEEYCRKNEIDFEWKGGGRLRTKQLRRAVGRHPYSGEPVWFNHMTFFHVTTLEPSVRDAMLSAFAEEDLPNNTYHADGSSIAPEVMQHLQEIYRSEMVSFPWQQGDVLMLDNMMTAHAREAFTGPRKVVVGMAEPYRWADVENVIED
jgi:alpha-ketoglutarate-dependent taurine dioxygenase